MHTVAKSCAWLLEEAAGRSHSNERQRRSVSVQNRLLQKPHKFISNRSSLHLVEAQATNPELELNRAGYVFWCTRQVPSLRSLSYNPSRVSLCAFSRSKRSSVQTKAVSMTLREGTRSSAVRLASCSKPGSLLDAKQLLMELHGTIIKNANTSAAVPVENILVRALRVADDSRIGIYIDSQYTRTHTHVHQTTFVAR